MKARILEMLRSKPPDSARERVVIAGAEVRWMTSLAAQVFRNELRRSKLITNEPIPLEVKKKYPFESLGIGDYFLIVCEPERREKMVNSLTSCRNWQQQKSRKAGREKRFVLRQTHNGVRVWRVA
jgi:hypothetical protein